MDEYLSVAGNGGGGMDDYWRVIYTHPRTMGGAIRDFEEEYNYTIDGTGELKINHRILPFGKMPLWLPRIGLTMTFDKSLDRVNWYGRGPQENYPDRKTGYKLGIYDSTVEEMYKPYLLPQDYGLRTDNRWVKLLNEQGNGIAFKVNEPFNFIDFGTLIQNYEIRNKNLQI